MVPILLVTGIANSGKSTLSDMICKTNPNTTQLALADPIKRFVGELFDVPAEYLWGPSELRDKVITVNPIKIISKIKLMNFTEEVFRNINRKQESILVDFIKTIPHEISVRKLLRWVGSEYGRTYDSDIWINLGIQTAYALLRGGYQYNSYTGLVQQTSQLPYNLVVISDGRFINEVLKVNEINGVCWKIESGTTNDEHVSEWEVNRMSDYLFNRTVLNTKNGFDGLQEFVYIGLKDFLPKKFFTFPDRK
jgi:hypothetical protein